MALKLRLALGFGECVDSLDNITLASHIPVLEHAHFPLLQLSARLL